jgi:adenosyl cobinamide kinase/adenosyl cobinamide phosphate guanylyltransferase
MTLTVTLSLSPEEEAELRDSIAHQDTERVREVLTNVLTPMIEALLKQPHAPMQHEAQWDTLADQLIDMFTTALPADTPVLSPYATSRAGIYEEHP